MSITDVVEKRKIIEFSVYIFAQFVNVNDIYSY